MSDIEPRPLSAFEELFLLRDHVDAPSSFFVKFEFSGRLDQELAHKAFNEVCELHPLASCKVERNANGRPSWVFCSEPVSIDWCQQAFGENDYPKSYFDPTQQRPLRVTCFANGDSGATLLLHVHHVGFDGLGALQLFQDWLSIYRGDDSANRKYNQTALAGRCRPNVTFFKALRLLPGQWKSIRATYQVLGRKVIPFVSVEDQTASSDPTGPGVVSRTLSLEQTVRLRKFARQENVSTNSVLARDLYVALKQWQNENGVQDSGSHYRLVMPFNERRKEHESMSACNHCTIISFDRSPQEISHPELLLASINDEVKTIQRWRLSLNFWRVLSCFRRLPGGLAKHASPQRVTATTLFSNLGRIDRILDIFSAPSDELPAVTDMELVPTLHRGMAIAIVVYEFLGRMRITMQFDDRFLSKTQADEFMDTFEALTTSSAGRGGTIQSESTI